MLEINKNFFCLKIKEVWFSNSVFEVPCVQRLIFNACEYKLDVQGFKRIDYITPVINLNLDLETIWKGFNKTTRNLIHQSERKGIVVNRNKYYAEFLAINNDFRKNKHLSGGLYSVEFMKKYGSLFTAHYQDKILGGMFFLHDDKIIRLYSAASRRLNVDKTLTSIIGSANRLIIWETIRYAKNECLIQLDLGGHGDKNQEFKNVSQFKNFFTNQLITKYTYEKNYLGILNFI